eukprot:gene10208-19074_t
MSSVPGLSPDLVSTQPLSHPYLERIILHNVGTVTNSPISAFPLPCNLPSLQILDIEER